MGGFFVVLGCAPTCSVGRRGLIPARGTNFKKNIFENLVEKSEGYLSVVLVGIVLVPAGAALAIDDGLGHCLVVVSVLLERLTRSGSIFLPAGSLRYSR